MKIELKIDIKRENESSDFSVFISYASGEVIYGGNGMKHSNEVIEGITDHLRYILRVLE